MQHMPSVAISRRAELVVFPRLIVRSPLRKGGK
jgi:hypothetical protein